MRPHADHILRNLSAKLAMEYVPKMEAEKDRYGLAISAVLMGAISEEFDRAAHRRIEENRALRKIFSESLAVVEDEELKGRMKEAAGRTEDDFRISALDQLNCELQETLIALHTHVESLEGEDARNMEEAIWQELEQWTKRREFSTWDMATTMMAAVVQAEAQAKGSSGGGDE